MKNILPLLTLLMLFTEATNAADSTAVSFKLIDSFAINAPPSLALDVDSVAAYLRKGCTTDIEKARAAFTWEANNVRYDDNGFNSGKIPDQSPGRVLKRRHAVCEGYSDLYTALCTALGLQAMKIPGYAKAYGYRQGERFENKDPNHAWNAVRIDGTWRLVDVTWGAGAADGERGKLVSHKQFTPYWFDVDKHEFIFAHYPADKQWLLIPEALTLRQYEEMPHIREPLFALGFSGRDVFSRYLAGTLPKDLPTAFPTTHQLKVVNLPLDGQLPANTQLDLTVISDEDLTMAVSNDLKQPPVMFTRSGNQYTASLTLKKGDLHIATGGKGTKFTDILQYKVK